MSVSQQTGSSKKRRDLDDFDRFLLHALGPDELRAFLGFARTKQGLETLLDVVHQVFGGIGIVQEILADSKLDRLLLEREEWSRVMDTAASID